VGQKEYWMIKSIEKTSYERVWEEFFHLNNESMELIQQIETLGEHDCTDRQALMKNIE